MRTFSSLATKKNSWLFASASALTPLLLSLAISTSPGMQIQRNAEVPPIPMASDSGIKDSLEYKLALLNSGKGYLPTNDITITRFRYLLERAAEKTGDTKKKIADGACKGQGLIRNEFGKDVTLLEFMELVDKLLSASGNHKISYEDAMLVLLAGLSQ